MSRLKSKLVKKIVTIATVAVAACSDARMPLAPAGDDAPRMSEAVVGQLVAAQRATARPSAASETVTIGASGGSISVSGVTLSVPAGALNKPVAITMTVPAGRFLEVHFEPHGLNFRKAATLSMELDGSEGSQFKLAYFKTMSSSGVVDALEVSAAEVFGATVSGQVRHFSGYVMIQD